MVATEVDVPEDDAFGAVVESAEDAVTKGDVPDVESVDAESFDDASGVVDGWSTTKVDCDDTTSSQDGRSASSDITPASWVA